MNDPTWLIIASTIVGMLIRFIKSDALDTKLAKAGLPEIPARALPWLSLVLGVVSGIIDNASRGTPFKQAVPMGILAGVNAIAAHELLIESARNGKEL